MIGGDMKSGTRAMRGFDSLRRTLQSFLGHFEPIIQVKAAFHDDWHERINRFIVAWTAERGTTVDRLEKGGRREIIQTLYEIGVSKGAVPPHM
jgi:D-arginine utilization repressor